MLTALHAFWIEKKIDCFAVYCLDWFFSFCAKSFGFSGVVFIALTFKILRIVHKNRLMGFQFFAIILMGFQIWYLMWLLLFPIFWVLGFL